MAQVIAHRVERERAAFQEALAVIAGEMGGNQGASAQPPGLAVDAHTRMLITLSDGRLDDEDGYRGDYGIEDTRQAVLEARSQGVHPFCVTIDDEAQKYLPHMFGPSAYTLVEQVAKLPLRVSDIYRCITV